MVDNVIVQENAILEGRMPESYWNVEHTSQIEGFATDMSTNVGGQVDFKINVNGDAGSDYLVEVFRLGYYGGDGARKVAEWVNTDATVQPDATYNPDLGAGRRRQLVGHRQLADPGRRRLGRLPRPAATARRQRQSDRRRGQPDPVHRARRRPPGRHRRPDLGHDLAGLQRLVRQQRPGRRELLRRRLGHGRSSRHCRRIRQLHRTAPTRSATTARSSPMASTASPAARRPAPRTISSAPTMPRSTGSSRTATTSATSPASIPTASGRTTSPSTTPSSRSATTNTGRPSSATTSRTPATPASTSCSGAATTSTGRPAGRPASSTASSTAPWSATRRPGRSPIRTPAPTTTSTSTPPTSGPAPGATCASSATRSPATRTTGRR